MRIAVPEYQGRIAPVFDCCRRIMVVLQELHGDQLISNEDWSVLPRFARPRRLRELAVELLICGGVSCWMEHQLQQHGIELIPWVAGDVWEVLGALRLGRISEPQYAMPGRRGCAHRRRERRRVGITSSRRELGKGA